MNFEEGVGDLSPRVPGVELAGDRRPRCGESNGDIGRRSAAAGSSHANKLPNTVESIESRRITPNTVESREQRRYRRLPAAHIQETAAGRHGGGKLGPGRGGGLTGRDWRGDRRRRPAGSRR